jgi:hypothetical protein
VVGDAFPVGPRARATAGIAHPGRRPAHKLKIFPLPHSILVLSRAQLKETVATGTQGPDLDDKKKLTEMKGERPARGSGGQEGTVLITRADSGVHAALKRATPIQLSFTLPLRALRASRGRRP